ncbi:efflux RND transporter periplasmic adaptor subunit [Arcicella aquatica]|uniref:Efflux RND transporter periplasmic adaptor subunit n=1 Tax=Arcicella aquatica TaxID=217141 RepID=A0ABU5QSC6_9BACT|nr:efflux RND transporter periplasmic adaptor subunit [Arcicella aquatica]MEA5259893.1 efflux RND transporter periplasmic adaptor subunit [Arcicella aquatica]
MKNTLKITLFSVWFLAACGGKENQGVKKVDVLPKVQENGSKIVFPTTTSMSFFATETLGSSSLNDEVTAPAKVSATVVSSQEGASQNIILFENSDLATNYTSLLQHLQNIRQKATIIQQKKTVIARKNVEVKRFEDLLKNGAGTGKDVANAQVDLLSAETELAIVQNDLANEKTAIIEHETKLKTGGFNPEALRNAPAGKAFIICDIPENQISKIKEGGNCTLQFTAFPNEKFTGKIEDVADVIDESTRMVKLRVSLNNPNQKLKAGMFATVSFGVSEGAHINVNKNALVTVQGKTYVFVKNDANTFDRREVSVGNQIGDRIIIFSGLTNGESIAIKGVMQLKGLSFGY